MNAVSSTQTFRNYCTKKGLELRCAWPEFIFTSDGMKLADPQATSGWMVEVQCMKYMVRNHASVLIAMKLTCAP